MLLLKYISAFVANIMSFIEALFRLRICLFSYAYVSCRREFSKNWYCSTVLTLLLPTMVSVSHMYCRQIARFHCVCLSHRECASNLSKFRSKNLKANLTVINSFSVLWYSTLFQPIRVRVIWKLYKSSYGCTREVWRAGKKRTECSPNFPSASIIRYTHR